MAINKPLEPLDILDLQKFTANGKQYFLEPHMSIDRYKAWLKCEIEIGYQTTFKKIYQRLTELHDSLNKMQLVDSSIKLRDLMESCKRLDDKSDHLPIMKAAALIINTADEDRNAYDEKMIANKIADWKEAGIPITSFFAVVLRSGNGLLESYRENTRDTSAKD